MPKPPEIIKGRGAISNPGGRFESRRVEVVNDGWSGDDDAKELPPLETTVTAEHAKSILTRNDSPDVGFDVSINPYRGCEHGCVYCLAPETPVLHADMSWRPLGEVRVGDTLVGFDELPKRGRTRKLRPARVEAMWWSRRPTSRLITRSAEVVATPEHRWLQARDFRWWRTEQLRPGKSLRRIPLAIAPEIDDDYRAGYVASAWRDASREPVALARILEYLK